MLEVSIETEKDRSNILSTTSDTANTFKFKCDREMIKVFGRVGYNN